MHQRPWVSILVASIVGLWFAFVPGPLGSVRAADVSSHPFIGEPAPEFSLKTVSGGELALKNLREKYVVIHFGASW